MSCPPYFYFKYSTISSSLDPFQPYLQDFFTDYCHYFLEVCLDKIKFMDEILGLHRIDDRINGYIKDRNKERGAVNPIDQRAGKLLRALFLLNDKNISKNSYLCEI